MKYTNFRDSFKKDNTAFAKVDIITGWWIFKKTKTIQLYKSVYSSFWEDIDSNVGLKGMPLYMEDAWKAKELLSNR